LEIKKLIPIFVSFLFKFQIMKKLCIILLLFISFPAKEAPKKDVFVKQLKKADFRESFKYILSKEGFWVNHPDDRGGATYCGITKVYQKDWKGWKYINKHRKWIIKDGKWIEVLIPWNTHFNDKLIDFYVQDFYLDLWISSHYYELKDQKVANYVFDFQINGTVSSRIIRRSLIDLGFKVPIKNSIDSLVISCINRANKQLFLKTLQSRRLIFYNNIALRDESQRKFLNHWKSRCEI
jgi:hypothetical protein